MASWSDDGSGKCAAEGATVRCTGEASGTPYNAIYKEGGGISEGTHCWRFTVVEGSGAFIGVTTEAKFKQGWGVRGMLYSGNTSSGAGLVEAGFGPALKAGDKACVMVAFGAGKIMEMGVVVNGRRLGVAFATKTPVAAVYPMVQFNAPGAISVETCEAPCCADWRVRQDATGTGFEGSWKGEEADGVPATVELTVAGDKVEVKGKVVNALNTMWTIAGEKVTPTGRVIATRKAGPDGAMALETKFSKLLETADTAAVADGHLTISGSGASMKLARYTSSITVSDQNPLE